jgi:riboflavin synthase
MFTGIVEGIGRIARVEEWGTARRVVVEAAGLAVELAPGDSVSVDGACLTVVTLDPTSFGVDLITPTLERTIASDYRPEARVNLERAMRIDRRLDGHLIQGHIDGVGRLESVGGEGADRWMDFRIPSDVASGTVLHGSIALNGVSLTVSELVSAEVVRIGVIPLTIERTNLGALRPGDPVNVEGDLIGKYVGRMLAVRGIQGENRS